MEIDYIDGVSPIVADDWDTALYVMYLYLASRPEFEPPVEVEVTRAKGESRPEKVKGTVVSG
ncbi:MAG: hypothetical protein QI223_01630 [Candidatus Korarchaeota archaeon]|nr:hypothetical protein [Candidatus Korarchaeota archaeon]